ncbi:DNA primase [Prochlorococcus sp. MIT 1341]|uniref:DNA primase n=1 Tax=Prochlorococcus sp. MIT 1341 TaxID=3096221 RepID=UPI002A765C6B|nr:DNA primase [Prochlorococcus sp. MIT 1341]
MPSPRLHPRTIEAVKERSDIVDVVGEHVVLKKKGREFIGICPFHDDSKPSMTVSPAKQFYYCFSCGAGGNSIKFLMEFQKLSFSEVVLELARKYQLPVETADGPSQERFRQQLSRREKLHRALSLAEVWFRSQLRTSKGAEALRYLINTRGLSESSLDVFGLGYAPEDWDGLLRHLENVERLPAELLEAAGLVVSRKGGDGFYDRFRGRIMVPIHDRQGRVIGFGGRSLDGSEPKYLNSPETELFEKGKHLFGLNRAANSIRKEDRAIVVEGYFDVISLYSAGLTNSVASLGTALSNQQITNLCRCTENKRIVLNFDSDGAGIRAANRAIGEVEQLALQGQLELRVLHLPLGKDPDEFLQVNSPGEYRALLDQAPLWLDWQIEQAFQGNDLTNADEFQKVVGALVELLGKLPQTAVRTHYLQKVAERLSGGQGRMALQLEEDLRQQVKGQRWHGRSSRFEQPGEASQRERSEVEILGLYLHCPAHRVAIRRELRKRELEDFALQHHRLLWAAITELEETNLGFDHLEEIIRGNASGEELGKLDLPSLLSDQLLLENSSLLTRLTPLLKPSEVQKAFFAKPLHQLRGSAAVLERQKSLKRCRHLLEAWSGQRLATLERCIANLIEQERLHPSESVDMENCIENMFQELNSDAIHFQNLYYSERKHIIHLDQQRCSGLANDEIVSA